MNAPADGTAAAPLADTQASLLLHDPALSPVEVVALLPRLVAELGLGTAVTFTAGPPPTDRRPGAALPVGADGRHEGTLLFVPASEQAVARARTLAEHAGASLAALRQVADIEHRERAVRHVAEQLQDALLPPITEPDGVSLAVRYRAAAREARVGGDFYDVFAIPDGRLLLVVGDVVGKGVEAAVRTSRITQTLRALTLCGLGLEELLRRCDEQVTYQDPAIMATVWCALYEPDSGELEFASLGHPPALLLRDGDASPVRLELHGLPLGMRDLVDEVPEVRRRLLEPGDLLVLYTDGVVEGEGDFIAGQQALLDAVDRRRDETLTAIVDGVLDEVVAGANKRDDALLLLLRRR